jgi:hypothetical protein
VSCNSQQPSQHGRLPGKPVELLKRHQENFLDHILDQVGSWREPLRDVPVDPRRRVPNRHRPHVWLRFDNEVDDSVRRRAWLEIRDALSNLRSEFRDIDSRPGALRTDRDGEKHGQNRE